jgi:hypothetical protein
MIQAFSHIFNFINIASPCGDMFKNYACSRDITINYRIFIYNE